MIQNQMANLQAGTGQMSNLVLPQMVHKPHAIRTYPLEDFDDRPAAAVADGRNASRTAELSLRIELGRTQISIDDSRTLRIGSVLLLDTLADDLVNVHAGGRLIGRGEVITIDGNVGVRMIELFGV
jgi:flagellar motor switch protein FliN/FliY